MDQVDKMRQPQTPVETNKHPNRAAMAPRWAAAIGSLVLGLLFAALPGYITRGFGWLPLILEIVLFLPLFVARLMGRTLSHFTARILAFILLTVVTLALASGVILMVFTLPDRTQAQASGLLRTAGLLWLANILVFSLWYWEIDGGGPHNRHLAGHQAADLMFPQQMAGFAIGDWAPHFLDYVFVSFTAATALSPTDTYPLTRTAKALMMIESLISLTVVLLLAARAVNIL